MKRLSGGNWAHGCRKEDLYGKWSPFTSTQVNGISNKKTGINSTVTSQCSANVAASFVSNRTSFSTHPLAAFISTW